MFTTVQRSTGQLTHTYTHTPPNPSLSFTHCLLPWRSDPCWANLCSRGEGGDGGKCIVGKKGAEATPAVYIQIKWIERDRHTAEMNLTER